jgi:hypothetical protein
MLMTVAAVAALVLAADPADGRLLLCRPVVTGDPALARGEELAEAGRLLPALFLDYGVACPTAGEASRAARRAGLGHAVRAVADGSGEGSRFELTLLDATEVELARRQIRVSAGDAARGPLRRALRELEAAVPRAPSPVTRVVGWGLVGAGAAAATVGVILAVRARADARSAREADTPQAAVDGRDAWRRTRTLGTAALATGGALAAVGLTVRFAF